MHRGAKLAFLFRLGHTGGPDAAGFSFVDIQPRVYIIKHSAHGELIGVLGISPSQKQLSTILAWETGAHTPYLFGGIKTSGAVSYGIGYQLKKEGRPFGLFTELGYTGHTPFFLQGVALPLSLWKK